jgi:hypothetical protein
MTPTTFEDRLLAELRAVVAARPAPAPATAPSPARGVARAHRVPRARLSLAAGAAAATVAGVLLATGGGGATPAYAVEKQPDGSVTVEINSLRDAAGLQEKLRAAGIPAVVDYTPFGKTCREPRGKPASGGRTDLRRTGVAPPGNGHPMSMGVRVGDHSATFTIPRDSVGPGQTLVITSSVGSGFSSLGTEIVEGPVAPCQLVDAPPPPAPGAGGKDSGPHFSTGGKQEGTVTEAAPSPRTGP